MPKYKEVDARTFHAFINTRSEDVVGDHYNPTTRVAIYRGRFSHKVLAKTEERSVANNGLYPFQTHYFIVDTTTSK